MNIKEACDIFIRDLNAGLTPDYVRLANAILAYDEKNDTSLITQRVEFKNLERGVNKFKFEGDEHAFGLPREAVRHTPMSYILTYVYQDLAENHLKALNQLIVSGKGSLFDKPLQSITFEVRSNEQNPNEIILLEKTINAYMPDYYQYFTSRIRRNSSVISLKKWIDETSAVMEPPPPQRVTVTLTLKEGGSSSNAATIADITFGEVVELNGENEVTQKISDSPSPEYIAQHQQLLQLGAKKERHSKVKFDDEVRVRNMFDASDNDTRVVAVGVEDAASQILKEEDNEPGWKSRRNAWGKKRREMKGRDKYFSGEVKYNRAVMPEKSALNNKKPKILLESAWLESIAKKYQTKKESGEIGRSGSIKQGNYDVVAELKMQVYNVFIDLENEKGRADVKQLAEWVLSGNAEYARFSRNWKSDDTRVVILSLLSHHTDSAAWYLTNTKAYKLLENLAKTGDTSALKTDVQMKQWKSDLNKSPNKGGPSKS